MLTFTALPTLVILTFIGVTLYKHYIKKEKQDLKLVMVGRKFRPFFMLSFKNLVGISSSKND